MSNKTFEIPAELHGLKSFTNWVARRNKIPINPHKGIEAKANDPSTWGSYNQAVQTVRDLNLDGIGIELGQLQGAATGGQILSGIDLDHVIHDGVIDPEAQRIIDTVDSYTQISPSGTGIHILFYLRGDIARSLKSGEAPDKSMEFYTGCLSTGDPDPKKAYKHGRYFTVSGRPWGEPKKIRDRSEVIPGLHAQHWKKAAQGAEAQSPSVVMPQQVQASAGEQAEWLEYVKRNLPDILSHIDPAENNIWFSICIALKSLGESVDTFDEWSQRNNYDDRRQVENMWAHIKELNTPSEACKTLYSMAKLRGWNPPREGMPRMTAQRRVQIAQNDFSEPVQGEPQDNTQGSAEAPTEVKSSVYTANDLWQMDIKPVKHYIPGLLTQGLFALSAYSGAGKSWMALQVAHCIAEGVPFLGVTPVNTGKVLFLEHEMGPAILKERIQKLGIRSNNILFIDSDHRKDLPQSESNLFQYLEEKQRQLGELSLVVIDTYRNIIRSVPSGKSPEKVIYQQMNELNDFCSKYQTAILLLHHNRKASKDYANAETNTDCLSGSNAFVGSLRGGVWNISGKEDEDKTMYILLKSARADNTKYAIKFNRETCTWDIDGDVFERRKQAFRDDPIRKAILLELEDVESVRLSAADIADTVAMNFDTGDAKIDALKVGRWMNDSSNRFMLKVCDSLEIGKRTGKKDKSYPIKRVKDYRINWDGSQEEIE